MQPGDPLHTYRLRRHGSDARDAALGLLRAGALGLDELDPATGYRPDVLDVGFGDGAATLAAAREQPGLAVLAVEVYVPGVAGLLAALAREQLGHVRVHEGDVRAVLDRLAPGSLTAVQIMFPDPWPKSRHRKRRLVTPALLGQLAGLLRPRGRVHVATDWLPYARSIRAAIETTPALRLVADHRDRRPTTRYERKGLAAGRAAVDLVAEREHSLPATAGGSSTPSSSTCSVIG